MGELTHFNEAGRPRMVDVSAKDNTVREALATGRVLVNEEIFRLIRCGGMKKGDVLGCAQVAGIMAAKRTWELIPMCHPLLLSGVDLTFVLNESELAVEITASVRCTGPTGVEMEALTSVQVGLLTIYDMCKAVDRGMTITDVRLEEKRGGKSGVWLRPTE